MYIHITFIIYFPKILNYSELLYNSFSVIQIQKYFEFKYYIGYFFKSEKIVLDQIKIRKSNIFYLLYSYFIIIIPIIYFFPYFL